MKVAVISDLHANIHALRVVLEDLDKENVSAILVAGDLIGYYYWPAEVVNLLMADERFICIRGNHENILHQVLGSEEAAHRYYAKYGSGYEVCRRQLSETQLQWLFSLPEKINVTLDGITFHVGHGALGSTDEYLYPNAPIERLLGNYSEATYTIFGHTHYPFFHEHGGRYLLNPGSVGQPRDTGGLASYLVVNTTNKVVRFKRRAFDKDAIIAAALEKDPSLGYLADIMNR
ncbi:metallophosphoesterase family protein [Pseudomonas neustonica]|uniref:Phosphoesterase n=1 Tax=Pseudomonas neustonica TaxID=2487346 RepID=A0ABX9XPE3_9PSED|nr:MULTISPECIES: metallophosphoesterase family protein [Pseudomonas]MBA6420464.1 metallophosphoesterase family protein [Pseudomonas sp. 5Ae-yellow]ROZ87209.1 metallophosphoesterase [Pseudomonas sp. SSM44]ROZ88174.1 metallophosphoesterase [Pseudomonas neustonica]|tara:strand:- start:60 stop:755 length:696 start_codon:yes stop_codon:yes gene_type:complete